MKTWPLTAWHHSFKQLLCYDIISWCKSYHPVKHATHDTAPGEVGGTRWMTHLAWCSQTPVRAKHYTAPWAYICDYNLVSIPSPKIIWTGLGCRIISLVSFLLSSSLFVFLALTKSSLLGSRHARGARNLAQEGWFLPQSLPFSQWLWCKRLKADTWWRWTQACSTNCHEYNAAEPGLWDGFSKRSQLFLFSPHTPKHRSFQHGPPKPWQSPCWNKLLPSRPRTEWQ